MQTPVFMGSIVVIISRSAIATSFALALIACNSISFAEGETYRMPEYAAGDPPPPRSRAEVEKLLAGADDNAKQEDAAKKPLRIVLVAGPKDHAKGEHDYPNWQKVWSRLLAQAPNTNVETAFEFPKPEQIEDADVLVFYQRGRWDDDRAAAIDPFLARGGGLVYIHWAVDGRGQQAEMAQRIGLSALGGGIKYRHGELKMDFSPGADHPITRNLGDIRWMDESYWKLTGDPKQINVLGTAVEDDEPQPLFWTVERGRGRVFVSIPGHYMWTFDDPAFRTVLLRGIAWAGRRDVDRFNDLVTLDARVE
jgi:type 1 glutamine amidotransferase